MPCTAKSTIVVVPPWAAATVPVWKSSDAKVPPKGSSMWVCTSMPPGMTYLPVASMRLAPAAFSPLPIMAIFSPSTSTSPLYVSAAVTIVPLVMSVFGMSLPSAPANASPRKGRAGSGLPGPARVLGLLFAIAAGCKPPHHLAQVQAEERSRDRSTFGRGPGDCLGQRGRAARVEDSEVVDVAERGRRLMHDRWDERQCLQQQRGVVEFPIRLGEQLLRPRLGLTARQDRGAFGLAQELDLPRLCFGGKDRCLASTFRSKEHTSELQSPYDLVCRLLLEKKKI